MSAAAARARLAENPFFVLGATPDASRADLEREAQRLLGMLELGLAAAAAYRSPLGEHVRTPALVREAIATLRDPRRRLVAELWARGAADQVAAEPAPAAPTATPPAWPDARRRLGHAAGRRG